MKLYVIPVENSCNGSCNFCITKTRKFKEKEFLSLEDLERTLDLLEFDSIEITGGGEPFLHPKINEIVEKCVRKGRTQIYTNGALLNARWLPKELSFLCLSRMHYGDVENKKIMGVDYEISDIFNFQIPIKLSLLLHKSGIHTCAEIFKYLKWAKKNNVKKVVVRQLFDETSKEILEREFVSTKEMAKNFSCIEKGESCFTYFAGLEVEFELRACSCADGNYVLRASGNVYKGWGEEKYDINRK